MSVSVIAFRGDEALKSSASSDRTLGLPGDPCSRCTAVACTQARRRLGHNPALAWRIAMAMGTVCTQAVYICNEIAVCRSTRRRAQRARTTRTATRCTSRATPTRDRGQEAGFTEKRERLAGWPISWFGTDARAPIAPPPMRVQHFG